MTNLEFIEDEIKVLTKRIKELKEEEDLHWNYEHEDEAIECDFQRKEYEDLLKNFQQIKAVLEAWEVVKEELQIVSKGKNRRGEKIQRYELCVIGQDKINTLEKGLEVEDE